MFKRPAPFNKISTLNYVNASTMDVVETIQMREFYEFGAYSGTPGSYNPRSNAYALVRHYQLSLEAELNPIFAAAQ